MSWRATCAALNGFVPVKNGVGYMLKSMQLVSSTKHLVGSIESQDAPVEVHKLGSFRCVASP